MATPHDPVPPEWQEVMTSGDEADFRALVEPHLPALIAAARDDLRYYVAQGALHPEDLSAEEAAGEAIIFAWEHRRQRPDGMSVRGWLLGTLVRALRGVVQTQQAYRRDNAISLDAPLPLNPASYDTEEWFWEWYQPDAILTFEDVIPYRVPIDYEVPLGDTDLTHGFAADAHHVLMMHDEFEMSLPEVAFTLNRAVQEMAALLDQARMDLRDRIGQGEA